MGTPNYRSVTADGADILAGYVCDASGALINDKTTLGWLVAVNDIPDGELGDGYAPGAEDVLAVYTGTAPVRGDKMTMSSTAGKLEVDATPSAGEILMAICTQDGVGGICRVEFTNQKLGVA